MGLALSLALAINMQYYAVLLFVPLCAAEAVRMIETRRVDVPMLGSICGGLAGLVLVVPFAKALSTFQANHNHSRIADVHFITHSYLWLMVGGAPLSEAWQHITGLCCVAFLVALIVVFYGARRKMNLRLPVAEAVLLILLAAIPVFAFLLAIFVTHFVEARYTLPALIGVCAATAILLTPLSQSRVLGGVVLVILFVAIAVTGVERVRSDRESAQASMATLAITPEVERTMELSPGQPIYVSNDFLYDFVRYYSPSADMRSRIALTYLEPKDSEGDAVGADVNQLSANMEAARVPEVVSYESVARPGTERLFLLHHFPWDWTDGRLRAAHAEIEPLGRFLGGDLVLVRFP